MRELRPCPFSGFLRHLADGQAERPEASPVEGGPRAWCQAQPPRPCSWPGSCSSCGEQANALGGEHGGRPGHWRLGDTGAARSQTPSSQLLAEHAAHLPGPRPRLVALRPRPTPPSSGPIVQTDGCSSRCWSGPGPPGYLDQPDPAACRPSEGTLHRRTASTVGEILMTTSCAARGFIDCCVRLGAFACSYR